jgi:hypothetical protein
MVTRRRLHKLHRNANHHYRQGQRDANYIVPAPDEGPMRIAFDAGKQAAINKSCGDLPLDTWQLVLSDYLRRNRGGRIANY